MPNVTYKLMLNNKPKRSGLYSLLLRLTLDRERKSINTGYDLPAKAWNARKEEVRQSYDLADKINRHCEGLIKKAKAWTLDRSLRGIPYTLEDLQLYLQGKEEAEAVTLVDVAKQLIEVYYKADPILHRYYTASMKHWQNFEAAQGKEYLISDVNSKALAEFEAYLKAETNSKAQGTRGKHLTRIRRIYKLAVTNGKAAYADNPFHSYEIKHGKRGKRERLTLEEIKRLQDLELKGMQHEARNIWLAQFYAAGTRIGDMLTMKAQNIHDGRLIFDMHKTAERQSIQLPKQAIDIFSQYLPGKKPDDYIFPFFSKDVDYSDRDFMRKQIQSKTTMINRYLKQVADLAEIDKNLTTHAARHSFADMARKKSKDMYAVSKLLRHSSAKITEVYFAGFDNQAADDVMESIFGDE